MSAYKLYGDGIHDDFPAIQEMLDSGSCEVILPAPAKNYLITQTLVLSSNTRLVLPRFATIRLADGANCPMVMTRVVSDPDEGRIPHAFNDLCKHLWSHVTDYSPTAITENIEICGGIWDFNNLNQLPNPEQSKCYEPHGYSGDGMLFYGVRNIKLSGMTLRNPVHYGVTFDRATYFTVEDITFDYTTCNPLFINMDGVHFNGNCHFGVIRNLKGACYDDLVALNAHEGSKGPISNILIDGLLAENCHSAVRLLTVSDNIHNIHISNVYGTYYQYCIGLTKYYPGETTGFFDGITLDHIYASKASREGIYPWPDSYVFPFIYIQENTHVKNLLIQDVVRKEYQIPVATISVGAGALVENLVVDHVVMENHTDSPMPLLANNGEIRTIAMTNIRDL
ncbi:MAG: hypothetical protein IJ315_06040 [Firmicutes bacterium]|nr:hypothetical protein [Bacillota bacterium]